MSELSRPITNFKPCPNPWCERKYEPIMVSHVEGGKAKGFRVHCYVDCGIKGPVAATELGALNAWNSRALGEKK